jgi:hypothetical protein
VVTRRAALLLAAVSGCTPDVVTIAPVIDTPVDDTDADPFSGLDRIDITIARAGDVVPVAARTFTRGQPLEIEDVSFGTDLVIHLRGFVGEGQVAYGRTCAFTVNAESVDVAPHVFFSRTQKFGNTDLVPAAREGGGGVSLLGAGLFLGGTFDAASVREIERFDPVTGQLAPLIEMVRERTGAVEAVIGKSPPRVVLLGGKAGATNADFFEVIDLKRTGRVVDVNASSLIKRTELTATSLTDGRVVAIGGRDIDDKPVATITEITLDGSTPEVEDLPRAVLAHPRSRHTATRLGDDVGAPVLIVGGVDAAGVPIGVAELFKPPSRELASPLTFAPTMITPRSRHAAALLPDGSVLIIGGVNAGGMVRELERYTRDAGFIPAGMLDVGLVDATVTPLPDGRTLITGGRNSVGGPPTDVAQIALLTEAGNPAVVATDRLSVARAGHQAAALCDGTILITGGAAEGTTAERYNPPDVGRR